MCVCERENRERTETVRDTVNECERECNTVCVKVWERKVSVWERESEHVIQCVRENKCVCQCVREWMWECVRHFPALNKEQKLHLVEKAHGYLRAVCELHQ